MRIFRYSRKLDSGLALRLAGMTVVGPTVSSVADPIRINQASKSVDTDFVGWLSFKAFYCASAPVLCHSKS